MRTRWLVVIAVASLCLNAAVVGTYLFRQGRPGRARRVAARNLPPEVRERMRQVRDSAMPGFAAFAGRVEVVDSVLWAEMRRDQFDSARVDSLCGEMGRLHGQMRAMVFGQMHRELQLLPEGRRAEYLRHMMEMRPGSRMPGRTMVRGRRMMNRPGMLPDEPPPGRPPMDEPPPDESGR